MKLPWVSRAQHEAGVLEFLRDAREWGVRQASLEAEIELQRRRVDEERDRHMATLRKQVEDATAERRATQDRLIAAIDQQSALMVEVTKQLTATNRPPPAATIQRDPTLEELTEQRATAHQIKKVVEGLLAEADRKKVPMSPDEAEQTARDMLGYSITGGAG